MITSRSLKTLSLAAAAIGIALLGACSSTPVSAPAAPKPAATSSTQPSATPSTASSKPAPAATVATVTLPAHLDPKSDIFKDRSVYFDFDSSLLKPEFTPLVERQGKYLASNPSLSIKVEGNTDERGGAEYNLALGQRRAEAVRQALKLIGVKDAQMEAISWGKERPKSAGHDEAAWSQNRRADLVYPSR